MNPTLYNDLSLERQLALQKERAWDWEKDIPWHLGANPAQYLLPLDADAIAFPDLNEKQRLVLSQFMGLGVNATIGEMEGVIDNLKEVAWERLLRRCPVNPEMWELGELFFAEELKHARTFAKYLEVFCQSTGVPQASLQQLMPKAHGTRFLASIRANAHQGGFAFWWVVSAVEEVSIQIYQMMHKHEAGIDPLFFHIHRKHLEEEARHKNYAFLMLELAQSAPGNWKERLVRKTDLLLAQTMTAAWLVAELHRIFDAERLRKDHPFFETLASCLPSLKKIPLWDLPRRLFMTAPYVSFVLNLHHQKLTARFAHKHGVWRLPLPKPKLSSLYTHGIAA